MNPTNNYTLVTDLAIEQMNGHPVVVFGFVSPKWNYGLCMFYSRATGAWLMLNDVNKMFYLFDRSEAKTSAKLFSAFVNTALGPNIATVLPTNPRTGKTMNGQEVHQLLLQIRQHLTATMNQQADGGSSGRL